MTEEKPYGYRIQWSSADEAYVGTVEELPGLSWVDDSPETALAGVRELVIDSTRNQAGSGATPAAARADRSPMGETPISHPAELTSPQAATARQLAPTNSEHTVGASGDQGDDHLADSKDPEVPGGGSSADLGNVLRQAMADHADSVLRAQAAVAAAASALSNVRGQMQRRTTGWNV